MKVVIVPYQTTFTLSAETTVKSTVTNNTKKIDQDEFSKLIKQAAPKEDKTLEGATIL